MTTYNTKLPFRLLSLIKLLESSTLQEIRVSVSCVLLIVLLRCTWPDWARWLGLTYSGPECGTECAGHWTWSDDSELSWSNWKSGFPVPRNRCAVLNDNKLWYNHPCDDVYLLKFTCKKGMFSFVLYLTFGMSRARPATGKNATKPRKD